MFIGGYCCALWIQEKVVGSSLRVGSNKVSRVHFCSIQLTLGSVIKYLGDDIRSRLLYIRDFCGLLL